MATSPPAAANPTIKASASNDVVHKEFKPIEDKEGSKLPEKSADVSKSSIKDTKKEPVKSAPATPKPEVAGSRHSCILNRRVLNDSQQ